MSEKRLTGARMNPRGLAATAWALLLLAPAAALAAHRAPAHVDLEAKTAAEDRAALQFYRTSLNKLAVLCRQKENTAEEPIFLFRIAEAQYKVAALNFRLAHATKAAREGHPDLREYRSTLDQLSKLASKILRKFPRHRDMPRAVYLRAQAYKELEKDQESIRDFRYLIDNFPKNEDMIPAQIAIYELFTKTKDYKTAIMYLKNYRVPRTESYYPVSLDHLAFANFAINDIPEALRYLELELAVFPLQEGGRGFNEREKILTNAALFYFTGAENKSPGYSIADSVSYFKRLNPGPAFPKMIAQFSNLLRSKGRDEDFDVFKRAVMTGGVGPSEIAEVLLASLENSVNRQRYDQIKDTVDQLSAMVSRMTPEQKKNFRTDKVGKLLSDAANNLNQSFVRNRENSESLRITPVLISVYSLMLKIAETDLARMKIEYNMAEIFLGLKKWEAATLHYRWIADLRAQPDKESQKIQRMARFKSITARYEELVAKKAFPKDLAAKPFAKPEAKGKEEPLSKEAAQWVAWLDQYEKTPHEDPADSFCFEAARLIYSSGQVDNAINRLTNLVATYPKSSHVEAAQGLILDTYLASERWEDSIQIANDFFKKTDPSKTEFRNRLVQVSTDSYFKTIEVLYKNGAFADALTRAEGFLKAYPTSARKADVLLLAGNTALALKDKKRALTYLNPLVKDGKASAEAQGITLLTTGSVAEEAYDFEGAATAYRKYLSLPPKAMGLDAAALKSLRIKVLDYAWFSGQEKQLKTALNTPTVCVAELSDPCEQFTAILGLMNPERTSETSITSRAYDRANRTDGPARAAWAALALENPRGVNFNNRIRLLEIVASDWGKMDPLARYALLPVLSSSIPAGLRQAAAEIRQMSKLKLEKADIDKRTNLVKKLETGIGKVLELPWQRIHAEALNILAGTYMDFNKDLKALPAPEGLAGDDLKMYQQTIAELRAPFQKKGDELRKQAMDAASDGGVETEVYNAIAAQYYAEQPPAEGQAKPTFSTIRGPLAGPDVLAGVNVPAPFLAMATTAYKKRQWGLLAFVVQDAKEKNLLNEGQLAAARGVSFSVVGAQAEALAELKEAGLKLEKPAKLHPLVVVAMAYTTTRNKDRAKVAIEEFLSGSDSDSRKTMLRPEFAKEIAEASLWSGALISDDTRDELMELAHMPRTPASQKEKEKQEEPEKQEEAQE